LIHRNWPGQLGPQPRTQYWLKDLKEDEYDDPGAERQRKIVNM
jgi:hypothetical protein